MKKTLIIFIACTAACNVFASDYSEADKKLNKLYKQYIKKLDDDPNLKSKFIAAQRAWIKYKESDCDFQAKQTEGGSINSEIIGYCLTEHTINRIKKLEYYNTCEEGDLSCPKWN